MKKKIAIEIQTSEDGKYCLWDCRYFHDDRDYCICFMESLYADEDGDFPRLPKCKGAEKRMQNALNKAYERGHTL